MILFFGNIRFELRRKSKKTAPTSPATIIKTIKIACRKGRGEEQFTFYVDNYKQAKKTLLKAFQLIEAAGGVLYKGDQVLFIYRHGLWDLPKGKLKRNENQRVGACREVEEECNVVGNIDKKLKSSYHFYWLGETLVLKKTYWYRMRCSDFKDAKPQREEGIEKIRLIDKNKAVAKLSANMFPNIQLVFQRFLDSF